MQNYYAHCYKNKHNYLVCAESVGKSGAECRCLNGNIEELQKHPRDQTAQKRAGKTCDNEAFHGESSFNDRSALKKNAYPAH